ncbi:hypothetical protein A3D77_06345 [Candidatus Gottesmanbacteria bacterium RIFCSPHIGHO2_02_FULL_39_11]|uniref:Uncharacterized protein n=1 Tax=Candidatus Gottesmanbacteria bacterium RIFCSPHIGHO2_02_FULL_39_11 TaxID=1798382 RepID=A0A1F5ZPR6_9BACT|nr:MAG: hypothetical protein A3D77_06345 [Candidatus Gottesmanbacteria bacterium RIFCSPHIGHO2_02_FULL_39_11]
MKEIINHPPEKPTAYRYVMDTTGKHIAYLIGSRVTIYDRTYDPEGCRLKKFEEEHKIIDNPPIVNEAIIGIRQI